MTKIVINACYGGFGLSDKAIEAIAKRKGWTTYEYGFVTENGDKIYRDDIARDDPDLVAAVEELGEDASDRFALLEVVKIPDGIDWEISEYDGKEHVAEIHRRWS
jgi:hypothetical protein